MNLKCTTINIPFMPIFGETRKLAGFSPGKNSQVDVNEAVYT